MALYEYTCATCGVFEVARPMAGAAAAEDCPACGGHSPRRFSPPALTAPGSTRRKAREAADRSAHEPAVTGRPAPLPGRRARPPNPLQARLPRP